MRFFAVLDTNVLVSALLKPDSVPGLLLTEALTGDVVPVVSGDILSEYADVLERPKFGFDKRAVGVFLDDFGRRAVSVEPGTVEDILPDPDDVVFYAVLMEKRKEDDAYLITGNLKHYPARTYIVTPKEMLDIITEAE